MIDNEQANDDECCPECGGCVGCDADGRWRCIAVYGIELGCGWSGDDHGQTSEFPEVPDA